MDFTMVAQCNAIAALQKKWEWQIMIGNLISMKGTARDSNGVITRKIIIRCMIPFRGNDPSNGVYRSHSNTLNWLFLV